MTPSQLKYEVEAAGHERHFFDRKTMKFFGEYAEETLAEQVKWAVARYEDKAPPKNPNQMEMSV